MSLVDYHKSKIFFLSSPNILIFAVVAALAMRHERPQGPAGDALSLHQGLHGEIEGGHQAVELGMGEGNTKYRGRSSII